MKKNFIVFACISIVSLSVAFAMDKETQQNLKQEYINKVLASIDGKRIRIKGQVVDQDGKPLSNVIIEIKASQNIMFYNEKDKITILTSTDGFFDYTEIGYTDIYVSFSKKEYHAIRNKCYSLQQNQKTTSTPNGRDSNEYLDETIIMNEVGKIPKNKVAKILWQYIPMEDDRIPIIQFPDFKTKLVPIETLDNKVKYFKITRKKIITDQDNNFDYYLDYCSPISSDGFFEEKNVDTQLKIESLTEAPVDGYTQKKIKLSTNERRYFYFKNGNIYGKILLFPYFTRKHNNNIELTLYLFIFQNEENDPAQRRNVRGNVW